MYLFDLQTVAPDSFQQITQAGDERVLLHTSDANLPVAQLHRFPSHLLHQHAFGLSHRSHGISYSLNPGLSGSTSWILIPVLFKSRGGSKHTPYFCIPLTVPLQTSSWSVRWLKVTGWRVWAGGEWCPGSWPPGCTSALTISQSHMTPNKRLM